VVFSILFADLEEGVSVAKEAYLARLEFGLAGDDVVPLVLAGSRVGGGGEVAYHRRGTARTGAK